MAESSLPWGRAADDPAAIPPMYQERWRALFGGLEQDGIVNDRIGSGLQVSIFDSTHVTVAAGEAVIRGVHYQSTAVVTLTRGASAYEMIVLRYNPSAQTVNLAVIGASSFSGVVPTQNTTGTWEVPLARVQVGSSTVVDLRRWIGSIVTTQPSNDTFSFAGENPPLGTFQVFPYNPALVSGTDGGVIRVRALVAGVPTWRQIHPVPWTTPEDYYIPGSDDRATAGELYPSAGGVVGLPPLRWRQAGGALQISGTRARKTPGGSAATWTGPGAFTIAQLPANQLVISSSGVRFPLTAQIAKAAEPSAGAGYSETVVPAFLDCTGAGSTVSLYVVLPSGDWGVVTVNETIHSSNWHD